MGILIIILVIGLGLLAKKLLADPIQSLLLYPFQDKKKSKGEGGQIMFNNWLKLALFAFVGIIISGFALGLLTTASQGSSAHGGMQTTSVINAGGQPAVSSQQLNNMMQNMNVMMFKMNAILNNIYGNNISVPYSNNAGISNTAPPPAGTSSNNGNMPMM